MVSHIGSNDPNMNWLTTSMKTFDEKYPGVKTEYLSTTTYSLQDFIAILNQAIATHPDGIAIPILNSEALQPILDKAVSSGIPVVAFNISDPRPTKGSTILPMWAEMNISRVLSLENMSSSK